MTTYTICKHFPSGDRYAVEVDESGRILRAAGPLHHTDPVDTGSIRDRLGLEDPDDAETTGTWLDGESGSFDPPIT